MGGPGESSSTAAPATAPARTGQPRQPMFMQRIKEMQRLKEQQRSQELAALAPGSIYLMLLARDGLKDNNFHWILYHHLSSDAGGWKYHIVGGFGSPWIADHELTTAALDHQRLLGMIRLGDVGVSQESVDVVRKCVVADDDQINILPGIRCRVYAGLACERLRELGLLALTSWDALQQEAMQFGNALNPDLIDLDNVAKPRPVVESSVANSPFSGEAPKPSQI